MFSKSGDTGSLEAFARDRGGADIQPYHVAIKMAESGWEPSWSGDAGGHGNALMSALEQLDVRSLFSAQEFMTINLKTGAAIQVKANVQVELIA